MVILPLVSECSLGLAVNLYNYSVVYEESDECVQSIKKFENSSSNFYGKQTKRKSRHICNSFEQENGSAYIIVVLRQNYSLEVV